MKTVNFAVAIRNLQGETLKDQNKEAFVASKVLADGLIQVKAQQPMRQMEIARKIYESKGPIQLEDADFKLVEDAIPGLNFTCVMAATLEQCIKLAKDEDPKKNKKG